MKAAVLTGYNKKGCDLEIRDIPVPKISENEVLVKIRTAGVNPLDNMIIRGEVKLIVPYSFPLVMGNEFVGTVEKTGAAVRKFAVGDRVYGRMPLKKIGAFAEYAAVEASAIARVPEYLSDEEAALSRSGASRTASLQKGAVCRSSSGCCSKRQAESMTGWLPRRTRGIISFSSMRTGRGSILRRIERAGTKGIL